MRNTIALLMCIFLFAQCRKHEKYPFASRTDTLGVQWGVVRSNHIDYYFQTADNWTDEVGGYVNDHENAYGQLDAIFQAQLPQKLRFYIWTDTALARRTLHEGLGFAIPYVCVVNVRPEQTVGHEMTHVLSYWAGGITPTYVTRFINEGVAVAFDLSSGSKIDQAKSAIKGQNIKSVLDLWTGGNQASESVLYPVAGAFMEYMYKQNQPGKFDSLIKYQTIASAQTIYGNDQFDKLIADFNKQLGL